jgi:hypothetical protein
MSCLEHTLNYGVLAECGPGQVWGTYMLRWRTEQYTLYTCRQALKFTFCKANCAAQFIQ